MSELLQISGTCAAPVQAGKANPWLRRVLWLQGITLGWMAVECVVSLVSAARACSPSLLAFGADSLVELLSAAAVLLQFSPRLRLTRNQASRAAGVLLLALAGVVAAAAILSLRGGEPKPSLPGIAITSAALVVMPLLAWEKRRIARASGDRALAADAVQSATCAWLAAITLLGLAANAVFRVRWIDPAASLVVLPILVVEARRALRGEICGCC